MNLTEAVRAQLKFEDLRAKEMLRQLQQPKQYRVRYPNQDDREHFSATIEEQFPKHALSKSFENIENQGSCKHNPLNQAKAAQQRPHYLSNKYNLKVLYYIIRPAKLVIRLRIISSELNSFGPKGVRPHQLQNMRQAQEQELSTVENAQRSQFLEFSAAWDYYTQLICYLWNSQIPWDNYMSDYEATAYLSLEKLKEKHLLEISQLQEKIRREFKGKVKLSKDLMDMKKQVHILISTKQIEEAERLKNECDAREVAERSEVDRQMEEVLGKQEERLRGRQQMALAALLKRIQRDRNEQLKHRQMDSQRLIQRNKNLLLDLLNKQNTETRRTNQFLRFALGVRSPERKNYYRSKLFTAPQEARLKLDGNTDLGGNGQSRTMYNQKGGAFGSFNKGNSSEVRAQTSKPAGMMIGESPMKGFKLPAIATR